MAANDLVFTGSHVIMIFWYNHDIYYSKAVKGKKYLR